ncbi:MAG: zinc ribbon domain-containing protein [Cyanobacteria bacterium]|nr:zinc ribbon domain-containing protein [Cyanobacteria bacterium bin.51]
MPVYEFSCTRGCENYDVWRSIEERQTNTQCPSCGEDGVRFFTPPMTLSGSFRLKVETKEPKLVRKQSQELSKSPRLRENTSRPWMLNRGC